jgi:broad specificity phosphatase PhoE
VDHLWLLRHGETEGESSVRLHGVSDVALDATGREQMRRAGGVVQTLGIERVITSPLRRARDAVGLVLPEWSGPVAVVPDLREIDFGAWEGLTLEEVARVDPAGYTAFLRRDAEFSFPGGDQRLAFRQRIADAAWRELGVAAAPRTLAILHKGVIKGILAALADLPMEDALELPVDLGSLHLLTRPTRSRGPWRLVISNATDHLGEFHLRE